MAELPTLDDAWLLVKDGRVADYGNGPAPLLPDDTLTFDLRGQWLFPAWVDSHTHLVFAASRESEWVDRLRGLSYAEIAARGGGILNSARRLQAASEEELLQGAQTRLREVRRMGTGALEIKSGYGLTLEAELKMLRVIRRLRQESGVDIRATFLGAHAVPLEYRDKRADYLRLVTEEMLPRVAEEQLADYVDVFCEKGFFTLEETIAVVEAGARYGLRAKVHVNQFNSLGAVRACVEREAVSVDHLEVFSEEDIAALSGSATLATVLPTAPFFLNDPYPDIRRLLEADVAVALATDYNPGSTPSGRMPFVLSLACIKCGMLPAEAINAATLNGAAALEWSDQYGSIDRGKWATFFTTPALPSIDYLPYAFGSNLVRRVFHRGEEVLE
jgi:imidazolonepropionase